MQQHPDYRPSYVKHAQHRYYGTVNGKTLRVHGPWRTATQALDYAKRVAQRYQRIKEA